MNKKLLKPLPKIFYILDLFQISGKSNEKTNSGDVSFISTENIIVLRLYLVDGSTKGVSMEAMDD